MMIEIWEKIAKNWYVMDYNSENNIQIKKDANKEKQISQNAIKVNSEIDWNKDDDLDF